MEEHAITVSGRAAAADRRSALVRRWVGWRDLVLLVMIALMLVGAAQRLTDGFVTLIWSNTRAAVDLRLRHREAHGWFAGTPIYVTERQAVYPPATYVGLWPLVG